MRFDLLDDNNNKRRIKAKSNANLRSLNMPMKPDELSSTIAAARTAVYSPMMVNAHDSICSSVQGMKERYDNDNEIEKDNLSI